MILSNQLPLLPFAIPLPKNKNVSKVEKLKSISASLSPSEGATQKLFDHLVEAY